MAIKSLVNSGIRWERVDKKLACLKKSYISLGGKITLIKSALTNLLVFYMSFFRMSAKVVRVLEKCQRDFLWKVVEKT